jgi:hypothetical protein
MEFYCPYCHSPIYSRKSKICGVCEKPLPENILLTAAQIKSLKQEMTKDDKEVKDFNRQLDDLGPHDHHGGIGGGIAGL